MSSQIARDGDVGKMETALNRHPSEMQRKKYINTPDDNKLTLLHYAARYHHYNMMKYLISNGAGKYAPLIHFLLLIRYLSACEDKYPGFIMTVQAIMSSF